MTASVTRNEKGMADVGRCLLPTTIPPRQPRRIQILFPRVPVISSPKACDVGPAVVPDTGCRAFLMHPGLVALPGSGAVLETPVAASSDAASSPAGAPGGHVVERVGSDVAASFLHLDRESANYADQHITESFSPVAPSIIGFVHGSNHGASHARKVVNLCQGFGNVCRA